MPSQRKIQPNPDTRDEDESPVRDCGLSHRDIGAKLGIGRARVLFHEQAALAKLRKAFEKLGIRNDESFICTHSRDLKAALETFNRPHPRQGAHEPYAAQHGWLAVDRVKSINDGSEAIEDVVRAYQFLKRDHDENVHPPLIIKTDIYNSDSYTIEAAAIHNGLMRIRCWPTKRGESRSVKHLTEFTCTAIVESEFASDEKGRFDIPIFICAIISSLKQHC